MLRMMLGALFVIGAALVVVAAVALFKRLFHGKGSLNVLGIKIEGQGAPIIFLLVGAVLLVVALRSAEAADANLDRRLRSAAEQELEKTRAAEAPAYAGEAFQNVVEASADLNRELDAQRMTFPFLRSYRRAGRLAGVAESTAAAAVSTTDARKEEAKAVAAELIARTKQDLTLAASGGQADRVATLRHSLAAAESALQSGQFLDARRQVEQVRARLPSGVITSRHLEARSTVTPGSGVR